MRRWSWETYWLVGGVFSWIVAPSLLGALLVPDLYGHIAVAPRSAVLWAYFFGVLWGIGGLTFGLIAGWMPLSTAAGFSHSILLRNASISIFALPAGPANFFVRMTPQGPAAVDFSRHPQAPPRRSIAPGDAESVDRGTPPRLPGINGDVPEFGVP